MAAGHRTLRRLCLRIEAVFFLYTNWMKREKGPLRPSKRDVIQRMDAKRDLDSEVVRYDEEREEEAIASMYLNTEQLRAYDSINASDQSDVDAFLIILREQGLISSDRVGRADAQTSAGAWERYAQFSADSFYAINRYLQRNDLDTPEVISYGLHHMLDVADERSIPLLLSMLREQKFYRDDYESEHIVDTACRVLSALVMELRSTNGLAWRMMVADECSWALRIHPMHIGLARILAMTGTTESLAYFTRSGYAPLGQQEMLAFHAGDFGDLRAPRRRSRDRHDDESSAYDHDFDDRYNDRYDDDDWDYRGESSDDHLVNERDYFAGEGLSVNKGSWSESALRFAAEKGLVKKESDPTIGSIDFMPRGATSYSPENRTEFLLAGYQDFKDFFQRVASGEKNAIDIFEGWTNREMAKASLILGFHVEKLEERSSYHVIGSATEIRARMIQLEQKQFNGKVGLFEKMKERVERQAARPRTRWAA